MPRDDLKAMGSENELLRTLVDRVSALLAYWDCTLRCRFANRAYERWFGVTPESLIGKHMSELLGPLYPLNLPHLERVLRGEPQEFELEIPNPSGGLPRYSLANYIPDVVDGVVRGFFVLEADISAIKRAELALKESEARSSGIVSTSADAIISIDEAVLGMGTVTRNILAARRIACEREELLAREQQARAQAEAANERLRESEERFSLTIDEAPIGMALVALDGRFVRVNRVFCEIVGYTPDELTGLTFQAITHPEDLDADLALVGRLARGEIPRYQLGKRYIRKDGTIVEIMLSTSVLRGRDVAPVYYIAQIEDITERKRLEDKLRLAEAQSSGILSISADAIISIDEDQRITMFNEGAEKIFGYSRAEAIGALLDTLIPERFRAIHHQQVDAFATERTAARQLGERGTVIFGQRKSGEEFPMDAAISKLDVGGKRVLTVALRDITEHKRIENEQRFLAEVGPALATTLDYEETLTRIAELAVRDIADFCIIDVVEENEEVRRLKVASRDPSKAWLCDFLMHIPLDRSRPYLLLSVLETRRPLVLQRPSAEMIASFAQSEEHHRALRAADIRSMVAVPLVAHSKLLGAIAFVSSTDSRMYGPADLRLAEELAHRAALSIENARLYRAARRATQARDVILGTVAHDLRSPLNTIIMTAKFLQRGRAEPGGPVQKSAEAIERSATRMNRLIQDLLDVTRLEAGHLSVEQTRVPAQQVVSDSVETQKSLVNSASLELRLDVAPDLPEVWADHDRLLQVFENLIGNALKCTKPGGHITVGAAPRDGDVLFWVTDTGRGIAPEDLPHLFDRFWQVKKAERYGAGLGLPIVKGLIEAHRGRIWVTSTPGQGSTFYFTIPTAHRVEAGRP